MISMCKHVRMPNLCHDEQDRNGLSRCIRPFQLIMIPVITQSETKHSFQTDVACRKHAEPAVSCMLHLQIVAAVCPQIGRLLSDDGCASRPCEVGDPGASGITVCRVLALHAAAFPFQHACWTAWRHVDANVSCMHQAAPGESWTQIR